MGRFMFIGALDDYILESIINGNFESHRFPSGNGEYVEELQVDGTTAVELFGLNGICGDEAEDVDDMLPQVVAEAKDMLRYK